MGPWLTDTGSDLCNYNGCVDYAGNFETGAPGLGVGAAAMFNGYPCGTYPYKFGSAYSYPNGGPYGGIGYTYLTPGGNGTLTLQPLHQFTGGLALPN